MFTGYPILVTNFVSQRTSGTPVPFHLNMTNRNGSITIRLPRTFKGLMTIYAKNGRVKYSDEVSEHMTVCTEDKHTQRRFVGDFSSFDDDDEGWTGDELNVETHVGNVKVHFVDEVIPQRPRAVSPVKGILYRVVSNIFLR